MMICLSIMALIRILFCFFFCESTGNTLTLTSSGYLMRDIWLYNTSPICCGNGFAKSKIGCLSLSSYLDECLLLLYLFIVDFGSSSIFRSFDFYFAFFRCLFRCHSQSMSQIVLDSHWFIAYCSCANTNMSRWTHEFRIQISVSAHFVTDETNS